MCLLAQSFVSYSATLWTTAHQAPLSIGFSSKNTGVACHALLQAIFPTQVSNPALSRPALEGGFFTTYATWDRYGLTTTKRASHCPLLVRVIEPCQTFLGLLSFLN